MGSLLYFVQRQTQFHEDNEILESPLQALEHLRNAAEVFLKYGFVDLAILINAAIKVLFMQLDMLNADFSNLSSYKNMLTFEQPPEQKIPIGHFYKVGFHSQYAELQLESYVYHENAACIIVTFRENMVKQYSQIMRKIVGRDE